MSSLIPSIDETLGAAFIGFSISCVVFGVNTNQVVTYFARYPEDRLVYKALVVLIWILGLLDQVFIGHAVYFYSITNYGKPQVLFERVAWTLILQLMVGAVMATIVRLCFAMRVWRFSQRNITVTGTIMALNLVELGLAIAYTITCFQNPFLAILPNLKVLASFALGAGVLTDVVTACALCFFLRRFRTGCKRSDTLVNTLTIYAVNTGALTAAISFLTLIFYDLRPHNFQFMAFYFILSKLYAISFLCTLNTRKIIRGKGTEREDGPSGGTDATDLGALNLSARAQRFYLPRAYYSPSQNPGDVFSYGKTQYSSGGSVMKDLEIGVHQEVTMSSDVDVKSHPHDQALYAYEMQHAYAR